MVVTAWPFHGGVIALVNEDRECNHSLVEEGDELRCETCGATTGADDRVIAPSMDGSLVNMEGPAQVVMS
jgi:exosome complex RNA-binding protein Csl4